MLPAVRGNARSEDLVWLGSEHGRDEDAPPAHQCVRLVLEPWRGELRCRAGDTFQLLGVRGQRRDTVEVCDFRTARGVYVLYNDYGPTYVGRARGRQGLGNRLVSHHKDQSKDWTRFSWFSFDRTEPLTRRPGWRRPVSDDASAKVSADKAIDGLEAMMIAAFGTKQNKMTLGDGQPWEQLTLEDMLAGRRGRKVDPEWYRDREFRRYALGDYDGS